MDYKRKIAVARENHLCSLCKKVIRKGERYWYTYQPEPHIFMGNEHTNCEGEKREKDAA